MQQNDRKQQRQGAKHPDARALTQCVTPHAPTRQSRHMHKIFYIVFGFILKKKVVFKKNKNVMWDQTEGVTDGTM